MGGSTMKDVGALSVVTVAAMLFATVMAPSTYAGDRDKEKAAAPTQRIATIQIPGNPLTQYDISWFDKFSGLYLLADRSNAALDIFDPETDTFITRVGGFKGFDPATGNNLAGPDGVLTVRPHGTTGDEAWVGDGDSTVKVIDLQTMTIIDTISTGGVKRTDEMAYDPVDELVMAANNADAPPFATLISTTTHKIVATIPFPDATNGIEQPLFVPATGLFYISVPELNGDKASGAVAIIDPKTAQVVELAPVSQCQPAGLTLGLFNQILVGCGQDAILAGFPPKSIVLDATDGSVIKEITEVGGSDEVWFNLGDRRFYLAARAMPGGPVLGVVDAETLEFIENVPTGINAHSVAADPFTNQVFVPLQADPNDPTCLNGCIGVYAAAAVARAFEDRLEGEDGQRITRRRMM
jgi:DNA-binding beta-propeller fold protein YncE